MIIKSAVRLMISLYTEKGIYPSTFPLPNPLLLAIESPKAFFCQSVGAQRESSGDGTAADEVLCKIAKGICNFSAI